MAYLNKRMSALDVWVAVSNVRLAKFLIRIEFMARNLLLLESFASEIVADGSRMEYLVSSTLITIKNEKTSFSLSHIISSVMRPEASFQEEKEDVKFFRRQTVIGKVYA